MVRETRYEYVARLARDLYVASVSGKNSAKSENEIVDYIDHADLFVSVLEKKKFLQF